MKFTKSLEYFLINSTNIVLFSVNIQENCIDLADATLG